MICRRIEYLFKEVNGSDKADELTLKITFFSFRYNEQKLNRQTKNTLYTKCEYIILYPGNLPEMMTDVQENKA